MSATATWKVWLVLLGVFLAGGIVGGVVSLRVHSRMIERGLAGGSYGPRLFNYYAERLELTAEQRVQAQDMVDDAWAELHEQRVASREIMKVLEARIAAILTPEQFVAYEQLQLEKRSRWQKLSNRREELRGNGERRRPRAPDGSGPPPPPDAPPSPGN